MSRTFLAIGIVVLVIVGSVFFLLHRKETASVAPLMPTSVTVATSTVQADSTAYTVQADYPVFGIQTLDTKIKQVIDAGVSDLEGQSANPSPNNIKNEFRSTFDSAYISDDIVSVRLILSQYTGGAHDLSTATGITYNRAANTFLSLNDALALTGKSLAEISQLAQTQLTKQFGLVQFPDGIVPTADNFSTFTVTKDSVVFTLQEYQAEAYSAGMPEIVVPRVK